ncbi:MULTISPECIES: response regulator [Rheinheimera]|uniref:Response regulator n=1 Tax=Rheinheimera marina TaxID=1774958 RepID=A0ABV9JGA4_9GAMM
MTVRVLILDDSKICRIFLANYLQDLLPKAQIIQAESGDDAVAQAAKNDIQLAILDYNVPDLTGLLVANKIRQSQPGCELALLTANLMRSVEEQAEESGVRYYRKPITADVTRQILQDSHFI